MNVESSKIMYIKPKTMDIKKGDLKLIVEQIAYFDSFILNGYPLLNLFKVQELDSFFYMLNEPIYPYLVKDFWVRAEVYV